jgi:hypothetical protein
MIQVILSRLIYVALAVTGPAKATMIKLTVVHNTKCKTNKFRGFYGRCTVNRARKFDEA